MTSDSTTDSPIPDSHPPDPTRSRRVGLVLLAVAGLVVGVLPWLVFWDDLPPQMASNFTFGGEPNDATGRTGLLVVTLALQAAGALPMVYMAWRGPRRARPLPAITSGIGAFVLGIGASASAATVVANRGVADWHDAQSQAWDLPVVFVASVVLALIANRLAAPIGMKSAQSPAPRASKLELGPDERAAWSGKAQQPVFLVAAALTTAVGVIIMIVGPPVVGLLLAITGAASAGLSQIRVLVDRTGLTVHYWPFGWPRTHIDLNDIEAVSVIDVNPMQWGGWGYRGSLTIASNAAVVLRRGPGMRLDLRGDRTFVVTVDKPDGAADLLAAELHR